VSFRAVVFGTPQPAGSKRAFVIAGKARVTDANAKSRPWKEQVAQVVGQQMLGRDLYDGPIRLTLTFVVTRPRGHYLGGEPGNRLSAAGRRRPYPTVKPDVLKLARGVEDAMSGVAYRDDAQIVDERLVKVYGHPERVEITIEEMEVAE